MKIEFETEWGMTYLTLKDKVPFHRQSFFDQVSHEYVGQAKEPRPILQMIYPEQARFGELWKFAGKKTKVTIEVIE